MHQPCSAFIKSTHINALSKDGPFQAFARPICRHLAGPGLTLMRQECLFRWPRIVVNIATQAGRVGSRSVVMKRLFAASLILAFLPTFAFADHRGGYGRGGYGHASYGHRGYYGGRSYYGHGYRGSSFSLSFGLFGGSRYYAPAYHYYPRYSYSYCPPVYYDTPIYYSAPTYYAPTYYSAPTYYAPAPVYVAPAPRYYYRSSDYYYRPSVSIRFGYGRYSYRH
jgi:hypothetical protein